MNQEEIQQRLSPVSVNYSYGPYNKIKDEILAEHDCQDTEIAKLSKQVDELQARTGAWSLCFHEIQTGEFLSFVCDKCMAELKAKAEALHAMKPARS